MDWYRFGKFINDSYVTNIVFNSDNISKYTTTNDFYPEDINNKIVADIPYVEIESERVK